MKKEERKYRKLLLDALYKEIEWHKGERETGKNFDFEDGFITGLKQAEVIAKKLKQYEI